MLLRPEDELFGHPPPAEPLYEAFDPDRAPSGHPWRPAAVLFLLYARAGALTSVFTLRAAGLGVHGNQISLPGGRFETADDTLWATALRETHEELGILPDAIEQVAALAPEYVAVSGHRVAPFIGRTRQPPEFRPDPREVAGVLEIPVALLQDPAIYREETRGVYLRRSPIYQFEDHEIWGATARMLRRILDHPALARGLALLD